VHERLSFEREIKNLEFEDSSSVLYDEFQKEVEIDHSRARNCHKLDPILMQNLIDFNQALKLRQVTRTWKKGRMRNQETGPLFLRIVSCYRDPDFSQKLHLARIITWGGRGIREQVLDGAGTGEERRIYQNALEEFKKIINESNDQNAIREAKDLQAAEFKSNPVLPGHDNCPCGCCWPRSKHTLDPCKAIDANIKANLNPFYREWQPIIIGTDTFSLNKNPKKPLTQQTINDTNTDTKNSNLFWGYDFVNIPFDPVHWELPDDPLPTNPGSLDAYLLKNKPIGQGPLIKGDGRKGSVKHLQEMLITLNYDLGSYGPRKDGVDGVFGDKTLEAVEKFQSTHNDFKGNKLDKDGVVGPLTADSINIALIRIWYYNYCTPTQLRDEYRELPKRIN